MATPVCFSQPSIQQVVDHIFDSRCITRADQAWFSRLQVIGVEEECLINRVFEGLRRGMLRVVD